MTKNKLIIFIFFAVLMSGCQPTSDILKLPENASLYDLPEEEGGKIIYVTKKKTICHIESTKTLQMFHYYKVSCGDVSGWVTGGDQS